MGESSPTALPEHPYPESVRNPGSQEPRAPQGGSLGMQREGCGLVTAMRGRKEEQEALGPLCSSERTRGSR